MISSGSLRQYVPFVTTTRLCAYTYLTIRQGSGKTLAYGLPILNSILSLPLPAQKQSGEQKRKRRDLKALILAPARELALQVSSHLNTLLDPLLKSGKEEAKGEGPRVSIASLVGGMSPQKQRRVLERGVDVLVATPGRLWDMMTEVRSGRSI